MHLVKRISAALVGVATLGLLVVAMPASALTPQAGSIATPKITKQQHITLAQQGNAAVDVSTEVDCTRHSMTAMVTNKTSGIITPQVTFNNQMPTVPSRLSIEPSKTGSYFYDFSGNHLLVNVAVAVDGQPAVKLSPTLVCDEPVSFRISQTSRSAVTGYLQNNSTLVPQTVLTRVDSGDIHTEILQPGETRLIALPFTPEQGQQDAFVVIATSTGYESTYSVNVASPGSVVPLPKKD